MSTEGGLTAAYLLHQQPYRETSVIVDLLCEDDQYVRAVCKGVRGRSNSASLLRSTLQPFAQLSVQWSGRSELKSLRKVETLNAPRGLAGKVLYSAMYLNELIVRLSRHEGVATGLFDRYKKAIDGLADSSLGAHQLDSHCENEGALARQSVEAVLRHFEFSYLRLLGYGIDFSHCAGSGLKIHTGACYRLDPQEGFIQIAGATPEAASPERSVHCIPGAVLLAIAGEQYTSPQVCGYAKLISRVLLKPVLGSKPLRSRELFR